MKIEYEALDSPTDLVDLKLFTFNAFEGIQLF